MDETDSTDDPAPSTSQPTPPSAPFADLASRLLAEAALEQNHEEAVRLAAPLLSMPVAGQMVAVKHFRALEEQGLHVTPVQFYSPIPDTRALSDALWERQSELLGMDVNLPDQLRLVRDVFPQFQHEYSLLPQDPTGRPGEFYLSNDMFSGTDALTYYCMIRHLHPTRIIEVGGGHSTRIAALAGRRNGNTTVTCIEPYPDQVLVDGFPGLDRLVREPVQEADPTMFDGLGPNDILFIDSSHVVRIGGDVTHLFLEIIPRLRPGVVVHVHDIFLPHDYPQTWVIDEKRFWSEQYLLQAFLAFNSEWALLLSNSLLGSFHEEVLRKTFPSSPWWRGGSLWMQRKE